MLHRLRLAPGTCCRTQNFLTDGLLEKHVIQGDGLKPTASNNLNQFREHLRDAREVRVPNHNVFRQKPLRREFDNLVRGDIP